MLERMSEVPALEDVEPQLFRPESAGRQCVRLREHADGS